jgi:hypothetical protein
MTATTATANTTTANDKATTVDVEVISSENTTDKDTAAKSDAKDKATAKAKSIDARHNERQLEEAFDNLAQARESNAGYAEAGPFYASKAPVANAIGGEIGVVTKDDKAGTVQRTGIGFYIRSDHFYGHTYEVMKAI